MTTTTSDLTHNATLTGHWRIVKHDAAGSHLETLEGDNLFTSAGCLQLLKLAANLLSTPPLGSNCYVGVGDAGGVTPANTDTDVATGSTNKTYQAVSGAPTANAGPPANLVFTAVFGSAAANYVWTNLGLFLANGTALLSHIAGGYGAKVAGQTWTVTYTISLA